MLSLGALFAGPAGAQGDTHVPQVCNAVSAQAARTTSNDKKAWSGWRQGEYFRGEGFTEAWTNVTFGHTRGPCLEKGIAIQRSGRLLVCGYYDDSTTASEYGPRHCSNAGRPASRTTLAQPTTVGAVHMHNGRAAAQWIEILVQENSNGRMDGGPCTFPSLRIATVPETWAFNGGYTYLHYGCTFPDDLTFGDADFVTWGITDISLAFAKADTAVVDPRAPTYEPYIYEGIYVSTCNGTVAGKPRGGFNVTATVTTPGGSTETISSTTPICTGTYVSVCDRTPAVRDAIVAAIPGVSNCADVRSSHLAEIARLNIGPEENEIGADRLRTSGLKDGDFDGLTALTYLSLHGSGLAEVPAGIFDELTALETLWLRRNRLTALPAGAFDKLTALENLFLGSNNLTALPAGVFDKLTALEVLSLGKTLLTALPAGVFDKLTALTTLLLTDTPLTALPAGIFDELTVLDNINLSDGALTALPAGIFDKLTALTILDVSGNELTALTADIFDKLTALTKLDVSGNELTALTADIFDKLTALTKLDVSGNELTALPADIFDELTALIDLLLNDNELTALPADIFDKLTALTKLDVSGNELTALPADIFDELSMLPHLDLHDNQLSTLPDNVFEQLTQLGTLLLINNPGAPFSPGANAGEDQSVTTGASVTLSASATGPWGTNVEWSWFQVDGADSSTAVTGADAVTLTGSDTASPTFTAPSAAGKLHFRVVVTGRGTSRGDDGISVSTDWVTVTVEEQSDTRQSQNKNEKPGAGSGPEARFENVPENHDGSTPFEVELQFEPAPEDLSYRTVAGGLLEVTGGTVESARRWTPGSNAEWVVTVRPGARDAVSIALPARPCGEPNAVCVDGQPLATGLAVLVPLEAPEPLTAAFKGAPAEHDGAEAFTVRFELSEEPASLSYSTVRDDLFAVTGGRIVNARREAAGRNKDWEMTVQPSGVADVTVALVPTTDCSGTPGVCTGDGRRLEGPLSLTVRGPAMLTVADAVVEEAADAALAFAVTLSRARDAVTTVAYATSDGSATAGSDYTATSGTLTLAAGESQKTISVPVLDDAHNEGTETLTLTLSDPSPSTVKLADAEATGTITNDDPMPGAWLARFGRTVGSQVMEAVSLRLDGGRAASQVTIAGVRFGGGHTLQAAQPLAPSDWLARQLAGGPDRRRPEERILTHRDLLLGSSFHMASRTEEGGGGPLLAAWGRVASGGFRGEADGVWMDGDVTTALLGFDAEWHRALAGLLLAYSEGDGGYSLTGGGDRGRIESSLTGLYPYARLMLSGRVSLWGLAGAGSGDLRLLRQDEAMHTGMGMRLGAVGVSGTLLEGIVDLAVKSEALWVRTDSNAAEGLAEASAQVSRVRLVLEGGRTFVLSGASALTPTLHVRLRHDGGDADTGTGVEVGAGIVYSAGMLSVEAQVGTLLAHEAAGYEEWSASGAIRLAPRASGMGPSLAVAQAWGTPGSGAAQLWSHPDGSSVVRPGAVPAVGRLDAELGYGLAALRGRGVLTPYARLALVQGNARSWHLGARLSLAQSLDLSLEGSRRQYAGRDTAHDVGLRASVPW